MARDWSFHIETRFADTRPALQVKYDIETLVKRLLDRDTADPDVLVFRSYLKSSTNPGGTCVELRLVAASDVQNLYNLRLEADGPQDPANASWEENLKRVFDCWSKGLVAAGIGESASAERYRQIMQEAGAPPPVGDDHEAIDAIQLAILQGLREGRVFRTAHHEGGTEIRYEGASFVLDTYGESPDREAFAATGPFLARLREFFHWDARRDWAPHSPPELEVWRFIERQMR